MIAYNFSKEYMYIKKYKEYKFDIVFIDCFHNVNFIRFKSGIKYRKEIIDKISMGKCVSISKLNELLNEYGLYCIGVRQQRTYLYYFEIDDKKKLFNKD